MFFSSSGQAWEVISCAFDLGASLLDVDPISSSKNLLAAQKKNMVRKVARLATMCSIDAQFYLIYFQV
jgi:hypothetical protein